MLWYGTGVASPATVEYPSIMVQKLQDLPGVREPVVAETPQQRSAVINGSRMFADRLDGRTALARRYKDLVAAISTDMGGNLSQTQQQLVRRAASLSVWCEAVEVRLASGEVIDIAPYTTAANTLRRLLVDIGYKRTAKDVTPDFSTYIRK